MARMAKEYFPSTTKNLAINIGKVLPIILYDMANKSDQYVPEDTGKTRVEMKVDTVNRNILWSNEYIEYIFWGIDLNFQKTHNPKAQSRWADRAVNENIDEWANMYADAIANAF